MRIILNCIKQSFYTFIIQVLSGRVFTSTLTRSLRQSRAFISIPMRHHQVELYFNTNEALFGRILHLLYQKNQVSLGKASTSTPTKSYQADLLYQRQPSLIRQSFTPKLTRSHQPVPSYQYHFGLIRQSFYINADQVPMLTKLYQVKLLY